MMKDLCDIVGDEDDDEDDDEGGDRDGRQRRQTETVDRAGRQRRQTETVTETVTQMMVEIEETPNEKGV